MRVLRALIVLTIAMPSTRDAIAAPADTGHSRGGPCEPCDADCDGAVAIEDIGPFVGLLIDDDGACLPCAGDTNSDGLLDGNDIQGFVDCLTFIEPTGACCVGASCSIVVEGDCEGAWFGEGTSCNPTPCVSATLTAYRPRLGAGYFPFSRTAVPANLKTDALFGPGIRINAPGDADPDGEDDLIELTVTVAPAGSEVALRRTDAAIRVWTTSIKTPGTEIAFEANKTGALPIAPGGTTVTLWVEWASSSHGVADLIVEYANADVELDRVRFHTFRSIVLALGGENQPPSVPVDPGHGTFVVGISLYESGYDAHLHDEDNVAANGTGTVYDKAVDAVRNRGVDRVAIFGYSHGGGSTYDLAERLNNDRAGIGVFEIEFTSYVDAVQNDSDIDTDQELRRPPSTGYHANHYQHGTLFEDFFLDGGPVPNSNPPPTGLDVETTPWGATSDHFEVDDFVQVRDYIETNLIGALAP